jgi:DNA-binding transcriptional regulator YhcF (GntR family)
LLYACGVSADFHGAPIMSKPKRKAATGVDLLSRDTKLAAVIRLVLREIESGVLKVGDAIPSISAMQTKGHVGRDTVVKAYDKMKAMGIVEPLHGKGFFVATKNTGRSVRTLVMFDTLFNGFKDRIVQGLLETAGERAHFDFFSHNFNDEAFVRTLLDKQARYERLVVMPYESAAVKDCLSRLDQDKLILLDIHVDFPGKNCAVVHQDFDRELEHALESGEKRFDRYERFELIFPERTLQIPRGIRAACTRFCKRRGMPLTIAPAFDSKRLAAGSVYLVIDDNDLVALIKELHVRGLRAGRDVGVISYNDTAMKEIVEGGVTVLSTDFRELGVVAARRVLAPEKSECLVPTRLIVRKTL